MSSVVARVWATTTGAIIIFCRWIKGKLTVQFDTVPQLQDNPDVEAGGNTVTHLELTTTATATTNTATTPPLFATLILVENKLNYLVLFLWGALLVRMDKTWTRGFFQFVLTISIWLITTLISVYIQRMGPELRPLLVFLLLEVMLLGSRLIFEYCT